jgi:hypothetical protein
MSHIILETIASLFAIDGEKNPSIPITLNVKGILVSGEIILKSEYFNASDNLAFNLIRNKLIEIAENNGLTKEDDDEEIAESHIYLKNAFYLNGLQQTPSAGAYIAVAVESIDSFSMGVISIG